MKVMANIKTIEKENGTFHPCLCTCYNDVQCYNCLNGAHEFCAGKGKNKCKKANAKYMGVKIVFKNQVMKFLLLATSILMFACNKETTNVTDSETSYLINCGDPDANCRAIYIDDMCIDSTGTNYHISYTVSGLRTGDKLFGGATNGTDTLSKVQLMPRNGSGSFLAGTRESGCGVKIYIEILKVNGGTKAIRKKGNCVKCN